MHWVDNFDELLMGEFIAPQINNTETFFWVIDPKLNKINSLGIEKKADDSLGVVQDLCRLNWFI